MFPAARLLAAISIALAVAATPVVKVNDNLVHIPLSKHVNVTSGHALLASDRARAHKLHTTSRANTRKTEGRVNIADAGSVGVENQAVVYTAAIDIGVPATTYNVIVDTGSSNTWVGAVDEYIPTDSATWTGQLLYVEYGSGSVVGVEYTDTLSLGNGLTIKNQSIGSSDYAQGIAPYDGILGIGPLDLTAGSMTLDSSETIPTVPDNLAAQGSISSEVIGIAFEPASSQSTSSGQLTFGGVDSSKFTGDITYTPLTKTQPSAAYWGIDQTVAYGDKTILPLTAGIVDTGTTLLMIASDAFSNYTAATGAVLDSTTGLLTVTPTQFNNLESMFFTISGTTFELTPNAQLWPRSLNSAIGGKDDELYLILGDIGHNSSQGMDFINGMAFLERFYSVFDTTNSRVGFATTPFTHATTN
ncbi:aspartic peptidase A1 [Peniophora sp. CONT]|nr:aspartic peptidase A1 [Peniophora sp. CONT]